MFLSGTADINAPRLETRKALLLIDLQNDFIRPDGKLFIDNIPDFLPKIPTLATKFREKGEVFWIRTEFIEPRITSSLATGSYAVVLKHIIHEMEQHENSEGVWPAKENNPNTEVQETSVSNKPTKSNSDVEAFLTPSTSLNETWSQCCLPGSDGCAYPANIAAAINLGCDVEFIKYHYSAFEDPSFLLHLRMNLITELYICGSLSNVSVFATVLDAVTHGMLVTIVEDCVGYRDEECHHFAMRKMADDLGANGIDYQELMDDLAGLLGDVIHEENYTSRYQVAFQRGLQRSQSISGGKKVSERVSTPIQHPEEVPLRNIEEKSVEEAVTNRHECNAQPIQTKAGWEGAQAAFKRQKKSESPPRKRLSDDAEPEERLHKSATRRASHEIYELETPRIRPNRGRRRHPPHSPTPQTRMLEEILPPQTKSTSDLPSTRTLPPSMKTVVSTPTNFPQHTMQMSKGDRKKPPETFLGPDDRIGIDSSIKYDFLSEELIATIFLNLKNEVSFKSMYHRSGEVPRLVAVQGDTVPPRCRGDGKTPAMIPIYRHPADASPPLLPFTGTVRIIREAAESLIGHPLNHVLIQLYRNSEDNISEHSDKTLDIVRGSTIVNYSVGAMRTMILRSKKSAMKDAATLGYNLGGFQGQAEPAAYPSLLERDSPSKLRSHVATEREPRQVSERLSGTAERQESEPAAAERQDCELPSEPPPQTTSRPTQRIPLPHNSLFILSPLTNQSYLHSIRTDKRPASQKLSAETAFNSERISLTFRHIGTFTDPRTDTIWGQGATGKEKNDARPILRGADAEREGERMIRAFGMENHLSGAWDWEEWYGGGFDVVDFTERKKPP